MSGFDLYKEWGRLSDGGLHDMFSQSISNINTYWENIYDLKQIAEQRKFSTGSEVHVWLAPLVFRNHFYWALSPEEKSRSNLFRRPLDQTRYITSHFLLRYLLGFYLELDSKSIKYGRTRFGKPYLMPQAVKNTMFFNMTHSEDLVCFIFSKKSEVGIDLEYINAEFDWLSIAIAYFSPKELDLIKSLPKSEQTRCFFILWTRKEARLKTIGHGLDNLEKIKGDYPFFTKKYTENDFNCGKTYEGSFVVNSFVSSIRFFHFLGFTEC